MCPLILLSLEDPRSYISSDNAALTLPDMVGELSCFLIKASVVKWPSAAVLICSAVQPMASPRNRDSLLNQSSSYHPMKNQTYLGPYNS